MKHRSGAWRWVMAAGSVYAVFLMLAWALVTLGTDRVWPATLIAYGPRWLLGLPLVAFVPLTFVAPRQTRNALAAVNCLSILVLAWGVLDFSIGLSRSDGEVAIRVMTANVGESDVTAETLNGFLRAEWVDVAAIQECPFYDNDMRRFGWEFYYAGDICLVSRYPFRTLSAGPPTIQPGAPVQPGWFAIDGPWGSFRILIVHLPTIREGLKDALGEPDMPAELEKNRQLADRESRAARAIVAAEGNRMPVLVLGDFNLPVESAIYRRHWADLRDAFSACGRGFGYTKFTRFFGIRIDHVLMSEQWGCVDARALRGPYGGDHAALIVDLTRPAP